MLIFSICSLFCAIAWDFWSLVVFRFMVGVGLGGETPVVTSLLGEFIPPSGRGRVQGLLNTFWAVGWLSAAVISYYVIPAVGWRWAFVAGALPALFVWVVRRSVPESPRWLALHGKYEEASKIVDEIEKKVAKTHTLPPVEKQDVEAALNQPKAAIRDLFSEQYIKRTVMLWGLWFLGMFGYYGLFAWMPSLLVKGGHSMVRSFLYVLVMQIAYVPNQILSAYLMDRFGRKSLLVINLALSGIATIVFGSALERGLSTNEVIFLGIVTSFFVSGIWGITYTYTPELYPTAIRVTGTSWAATSSRIGSMLAPLVVGYTLPALGVGGVFYIFAGAFGLGALLVAALGVETKGKSLESISSGVSRSL